MTDDIFMLRQLQEKFQRKKNLYHIFLDLEKAFDWVTRKVEISESGSGTSQENKLAGW